MARSINVNVKYLFGVFIFFLTLSQYGCTQMKYRTISIDNFEDTKLSAEAILVTSIDRLIIGCQQSVIDQEGFSSNASFIILKRPDEKWRQVELGKGKIRTLKRQGKYLFAIVTINPEGHQIDSTIIYRSNDDGENWYKFDSFNLLVTEFWYSDKEEGVLAGYAPDRNWVLMKKKSGQERWDQVFKSNSSDYLYVVPEASGHNYLIAFNKNMFYLHNLSGDFSRPEINKWPTQAQLVIDNICIVEDTPFFVGHYIGTSKMVVFKYNLQNNKIDVLYENESEYLPLSLQFHNGIFSMVISKVQGFGVSTKIIISKDFGKSWIDQDINVGTYFKPFTFFRNIYYGYSGVGNVRVVDLETIANKLRSF